MNDRDTGAGDVLAATDWHRLNALLKDALELDAAARIDWLATLPPEAQDLRPMLERLLAAELGDGTSQTLQPVVQLASAAMAAMRREQPGDRVGPWQLQRLLAEGGMGAVWLAQRADGVMRRTAALKLPRAEWVDHGLSERIARERTILARLQHPYIGVLYDAGTGVDGRPYLALEYVDGRPIDAWCAGRDLRDTVRLFVQVVRAVAYAHSQLVIHRDIKPSNVLVTADGVPKLLDFGISKLLEGDAPAAAETALTRLTGRALTLAYAAPEQVLGEPVGATADVYALGVLLFELLAGTRLYRAQEPRALEAEVLGGHLRAPSAAAPQRTRGRQLRGDLDAVVATALKRDPAARYRSAVALADDLERWLAGEPVRAQPDSLSYRLRKYVARNRLPVAAGGTVVLALAAGLGLALWQANVAGEQARRATALNDFVLSLIRQADPHASRQMKAADLALLAAIEERIDAELEGSPEQQLELRLTVGDAYRNRGEMVAARRVLMRAIEAATPHVPSDHLLLLTARVRAADPALIVSTAAADELAEMIAILRRKGPLAAELLIEALLTRNVLARGYGLPEHVPPQQRLVEMREADELARRVFGPGSRQHLRVTESLADLTEGLEGKGPRWQVIESALSQARLRTDSTDASAEYLVLRAQQAAELCNEPGRRDEGRAVVEPIVAQVRDAHGPTSALLEKLLLSLAECVDQTQATALMAETFEMAAAREHPPSTALLRGALEQYNRALGARDNDAAERYYRHAVENLPAIPEPALRERLTRDMRTGRTCQLAQRGEAAEGERLGVSLLAEFMADFERSRSTAPLGVQVAICLSDAQRQLGQYDAAQTNLRRIVESCDGAPPQWAVGCKARALSALAMVYLDAGQIDDARRAVEQRLTHWPSVNGDPRFMIAQTRVLIASGRAAEAIEPLRAWHDEQWSAQSDAAERAEALYWLGQAHLAVGDTKGRAMVERASRRLAASPVVTHRRLAAAETRPL